MWDMFFSEFFLFFSLVPFFWWISIHWWFNSQLTFTFDFWRFRPFIGFLAGPSHFYGISGIFFFFVSQTFFFLPGSTRQHYLLACWFKTAAVTVLSFRMINKRKSGRSAANGLPSGRQNRRWRQKKKRKRQEKKRNETFIRKKMHSIAAFCVTRLEGKTLESNWTSIVISALKNQLVHPRKLKRRGKSIRKECEMISEPKSRTGPGREGEKKRTDLKKMFTKMMQSFVFFGR